MYTHIHTYTHTHMYTYIHTHTHMYTHTYIHRHTYTYIHKYVHTYIHTGTTTVELMYKMDSRCTNNQAEAFAILKALEYVQTNLEHDVDKVTTVYTDSRTTLESLNNMNKHTLLTEEIRRKVQEMGNRGWTTRFRWTKAHVGTTGNELADKLAKEASSKTEIPISYNRIPKSAIIWNSRKVAM